MDIVGKRYWFFAFSLAIMVPGIIALLLGWLRPSIDFTGGTLWEVQFQRPATTGEAREVLAANGYGDAIVQTAEGNILLIRLKEIKEGSPEKAALAEALSGRFGPMTELRLETVGPTVGEEVRNRAVGAVALTSLAILAYIAWTFRKVKNPVAYGVCAVIALIHDAILVLGIFAILGRVAGVEIDALFVTALLTVIGFSVHDTIVVFDRIRENQQRRVPGTFEEVVNYSLVQTLARSINTSLTTFFPLFALYLFGGETIKTFVLAMAIGIVSGTFSSIFNASMLLVVWETGEWRQWFRRGQRSRAVASS
jgi:preprotein translocase subunit SecF